MAYIEERGDSIRVNWRLGGSRTGARQSVTFTDGTAEQRMKIANMAKGLIETRAHDMTRAEVYTAMLGEDPAPAEPVPTFKAWAARWIEDRARMRDIQSDVLHKYKITLESRAVPWFGHLRITDVDVDGIREWVAWLSNSRITLGSRDRRTGDRLLSPQTIRRTYQVFHSCMGAAVPRWLPTNPAARPAGARRHTAGLPKLVPFESMFLDKDEIKLILAHCDPHVHDMAFTAVRSGLRLGELAALESRYVTFGEKGATLMVRKSLKNNRVVGEPKSASSRRDVPVAPDVAEILRRRVKGSRPAALVFPSPAGKLWCENNFRERFWLRAVAAAQRCEEHPPPLPAKGARGPRRQWRVSEVSTCGCETRLRRRPRFHDLRHSHASLLIRERWPAKKIQARLGHASFLTTMNVYGHLMDLGDEEELASLERLLA